MKKFIYLLCIMFLLTITGCGHKVKNSDQPCTEDHRDMYNREQFEKEIRDSLH